MQIFSCDHCGHPVFFENVQCLHCGSALAFLPDRLTMAAIVAVPDQTMGLWQRCTPDNPPAQYRLCQNQLDHQACNFAVRADGGNPLCVSCRQTRILPDLSTPSNHERWYRIENAKRRLYYTLARLGLADETAESPRYEFLADLPGGPPVMTGHNEGLITLNIAEADDDERAKRRVQLFEPYRTLLGHLRHESGHYYWDRLIRNGPRLGDFRALFGDDSIDYMQALQAHYAAGDQKPDWRDQYVSAYAASHPWEDWAETWAHYLHMVDLLETAASYRTRIVVPSADGAQPSRPADPFSHEQDNFDAWISQWVPVTLLVNSLNRSLGQNDAYPFALSAVALQKLRFVHDVIHEANPSFSVPPAADAPFQGGDQPVQNDAHDGQHQDGGEHTGGVEGTLRRENDVAQPAL